MNGLVIGEGQYLDTAGQPSGFDVLQNSIYNNYTYQITVEKEISKYRDILLNLLHPSGIKLKGRRTSTNQVKYNFQAAEIINKGYPLYHYTGTASSNVKISTSFTNPSNNIIQFYM